MSDEFYRALEERFRASRDEILVRLKGYMPFIRALGQACPVPRAFDIGCGRGEWLELLGEAGFDARGVDLDDAMLRACHERGLRAENRDALQAMRELPDGSLELISAFHVVEHLAPEYLRQLLGEAYRLLSPGGLLIMETPNSENLIVGTSNFYLDPTHQRPVPGLFLEFLCQFSGFSQTRILRLQEDPILHRDDVRIGLWQVLYGVSPDYAVVARKACPQGSEAPHWTELFDEPRGLDLATLAQRHDDFLADLDQAVRNQGERLHRALWQQRAELQELRQQMQAQQGGPGRRLVRFLRHPSLPTLKHHVALLLRQPVRHARLWLGLRPRWQARLNRLGALAPRLCAHLERRLARVAALEGATERPATGPESVLAPRVTRLALRLRQLSQSQPGEPGLASRPRLAYVAPLPPERTGIANYSAELLPALAAHYQIDVIVAQPEIDDPWIAAHCVRRTPDWLREHAAEYSAVLYHVGNAHFHAWMVDLLYAVPGVVVLHDFYLNSLTWALEDEPGQRGVKWRELHYSHGHGAVAHMARAVDDGRAAFDYPFNRSILEAAQGVIVHAGVSLRLARQWYGEQAAANWALVPHLRASLDLPAKAELRQRLGLPQDAFVVCSFGLLGVTKLNDRLLAAWSASALAADPSAWLVYVGALGDDDYAQALRRAIDDSGLGERIRITGWVDLDDFRDYLGAADIAVQLRGLSRGETSGTVLDCLAHGLPTIVNANGSMADLPEGVTWRLPDAFSDAQLGQALELLWRDAPVRAQLATRGRALIEHEHTPEACANGYRDAIARFSRNNQAQYARWRQVLDTQAKPLGLEEALRLARQQEPALPPPLRQPQLLLDITATCAHDRQTGIERVARALTLALLESPPPGYRVEPVYLSEEGGQWHYRYACRYSTSLLGLPPVVSDYAIDYRAEDRLIVLDIAGETLIKAARQGVHQQLRDRGVHCQALLHDLLPLTRPELFPPGANQHFEDWLHTVVEWDGMVCVTRTVADSLRHWLAIHARWRLDAMPVAVSHHGADLAGSAPSRGLPEAAAPLLAKLHNCPSILMVGTLEPRKGYAEVLDAFERLWQVGCEINLIIVGREGWCDLPDSFRRDIPQLIERLRIHPERDRHLFWLDDISDEYLEQVYGAASGLLAASLDEGFGLPLIEAAQHGLPVLARDIPVFREVAGCHARFFRADQPEQLAEAVRQWQADGFTPASEGLPWLSWKQSAAHLGRLVTGQPTS